MLLLWPMHRKTRTFLRLLLPTCLQGTIGKAKSPYRDNNIVGPLWLELTIIESKCFFLQGCIISHFITRKIQMIYLTSKDMLQSKFIISHYKPQLRDVWEWYYNLRESFLSYRNHGSGSWAAHNGIRKHRCCDLDINQPITTLTNTRSIRWETLETPPAFSKRSGISK